MKQQAKTKAMKTTDNNQRKSLRKRIIPTIPQEKLANMFPWIQQSLKLNYSAS
jgi:hypothetical protein